VYKYAIGFRQLGPFVLMVARIFSSDIPKFLIVYFVLLMGFSGALYLLVTPVTDAPEFSDFGSTLLNGIFVLLGMSNTDIIALYQDGGFVGSALMILFLVCITIVLLNLLIAQMNDTYSNVASNIRAEFDLLRADYIASADHLIPISTQLHHWTAVEEIEKSPKALAQDDEGEDQKDEHLHKVLESTRKKVSNLEKKMDRMLEILEERKGPSLTDMMEDINKEHDLYQSET